MASVDLGEEMRRGMRRHPRVSLQGFFDDPENLGALATALPAFVPFKGKGYAGVLWVLDWDHRLPSRDLILRLYAYYTEDARRAGLKSWDERQAQITREELFPEFDVPDFAALVADEAYEAEMPAATLPKRFRLVSDWRRDVDQRLGRKAEEIVRASHSYQELASQMRTRAPGLGDLEAAEWAPPSESGHERWGIDVRYLRSFNGMVGEGTAFLVDVERENVVSQRDFQFRAG